jgi:AbrB family looped-hinge helix DNA binding protein
MERVIPIDGAGRLVIPKEVRVRLRLHKGSRLRVSEDGERIVLHPVPESCPLREAGRLLVIDAPLEEEPVDHRDVREERLTDLAGVHE